MDQLKVKDRILENISLSVKKLQSYFAACEDETPAIRNHDRVLQRLCEHLDHALLYGLQDISSGYWVLVLHFTRKEAVRQIEELQHIATNLGRSRAWLYLALSESSLESYLRLFQENQGLLQKYYFKNALVCSHDHLTLFLTLVSGLEFIRFDLELDVPYLDVAPYMPEYYKPQNLPDFEERLPSSDSLSLHSFTSLTSTNLEWDDSAIAPSSEDYDFGDIFPVLQSMPSAAWEEGDLTDPVSCPRSAASDPQTADSDTNTSADVTPVHAASRHDTTTGDETESTSTELEVIRLARRRKPGKKRRGREAMESVSSSRTAAPGGRGRGGPQEPGTPGSALGEGWGSPPRRGGTRGWRGGGLGEGVGGGGGGGLHPEAKASSRPRSSSPFGDSGEPPDPSPGTVPWPRTPTSCGPPAPADFYRFAPTVQSLLPRVPRRREEEEEEQEEEGKEGKREVRAVPVENGTGLPENGEEGELDEEEEDGEENRASPVDGTHPAEFRVDNNHLLLLMIHVFRENEEQLFKMLRMSTGHMEGDLQPLYLLLTDCYIYLLRKGAAEKPYTVEEAVSYNELDYISVGLDQQTITLVCTNRRRQFLLDTADSSLTVWFLAVLRSAMVKGCREPPYPSVLTDATMEKLALTKFVSQESQCEVRPGQESQCEVRPGQESQCEVRPGLGLSVRYGLGRSLSVRYGLGRGLSVRYGLGGSLSVRYGLGRSLSVRSRPGQESQCEVRPGQESQCEVRPGQESQCEVRPGQGSQCEVRPGQESQCEVRPGQESQCEVRPGQESQCEVRPGQESQCEVRPGQESQCEAGPRRPSDSGSTKEGPLLYRAGTTYLGKEQWKSCYLVLSNGILYQYPERTDVIPLLSITMGGEHCGGCRRANSVERPHSFQVILTDRPALELSAENEQDMAEWMQLLCQSVSKGVIPQGVAPTPCIPCCLVLTDRKLLTCHQDCQTSFFRSLGGADLCDITGVCLERDREYCIIEFAGDRAHFLPPWVLYFSGSEERDRLLGALETAWKSIFKVSLPQRVVSDRACRSAVGRRWL
ncbi:hypothetical protein ANANG_G00227550 [Anguilla anguilla]|uniref:Pleckstrin homology domain-containing family M member 2 n=1 Tax=Anguilla anguilla TaxID=7936 RepID=A0A9D3LZM5_ANGAN|nr:hypothetical protein ANANG_G00227550 [Anguilla anguilla]